MTKQELTLLRANLPHGSKKKIADKLSVSAALVGLVLKGKTNNPKVLDEAISIATEFAKQDKTRSKQIKALN